MANDFRPSAKKRLYYAHFLARVDLYPFYYPIRILIELGNFKRKPKVESDLVMTLKTFQVPTDRKLNASFK